MKKLLDHKLALVLLTLVLGAALGWGLKSVNTGEPEHSHEEGTARLWTCSMHPNVKLPEAGDCPICRMDLIPATAGEEVIPRSPPSPTPRTCLGVFQWNWR